MTGRAMHLRCHWRHTKAWRGGPPRNGRFVFRPHHLLVLKLAHFCVDWESHVESFECRRISEQTSPESGYNGTRSRSVCVWRTTQMRMFTLMCVGGPNVACFRACVFVNVVHLASCVCPTRTVADLRASAHLCPTEEVGWLHFFHGALVNVSHTSATCHNETSGSYFLRCSTDASTWLASQSGDGHPAHKMRNELIRNL